MIVHGFELLGELDGLIEIRLIFFAGSLKFLGPAFEDFLEVGEPLFVSIEVHVVLGFSEGGDELATCFTVKHFK